MGIGALAAALGGRCGARARRRRGERAACGADATGVDDCLGRGSAAHALHGLRCVAAKILVVNTSEELLQILSEALGLAGFEVVGAFTLDVKRGTTDLGELF
jgi:hypothetical protein